MLGILSQALSLPYSEHRTLADDVGARDFYVTITDISGKGVTYRIGTRLGEYHMDGNFFERNNVRCDRCAATHPAPDNAPPPPHWAFVMINFQYGAGISHGPDRGPETPTSLSHQFFRDNLVGCDALLPLRPAPRFVGRMIPLHAVGARSGTVICGRRHEPNQSSEIDPSSASIVIKRTGTYEANCFASLCAASVDGRSSGDGSKNTSSRPFFV